MKAQPVRDPDERGRVDLARPTIDRNRVVAFSVVIALLLSSCSGGDGNDSSSVAPGSTSASTGSATSPTGEAGLPPITTIREAGGQTIKSRSSADWVLVASGRAWVSGVGRGIGFYDASTGRLQGSVAVPQGPCASMDEGFGSVWTATCVERGIARIDPESGTVTAWTAVDVPGDGESSIGAGEGCVWAIADGEECIRCVLVRIDPRRVKIIDSFDITEGGTAVRAGEGGVWITYVDDNKVLRVDPKTGEIVAEIDVGLSPRFFDVGVGGVFVMNQLEGSVSHIDPRSDTVVATIPVDELGISGGDLTVGEGFVWLRASEELVAQIDPTSDRVVARIGSPQGSGSASAGGGQLWISAHDVATLYRVPVKSH